MFTRITFSLGVLAMLVAISCDRVPLIAPTNSTVTIDAGSRVVETGGSTSVSATVIWTCRMYCRLHRGSNSGFAKRNTRMFCTLSFPR